MAMLDLAGTLFVGGTIAVVLLVTSLFLTQHLPSRIGIAATGGVWISAAAATAAAGDVARGPLVLLMFFVPLLALAAGLALFVPSVRARLLAVPMPVLVGLNVMRAGGALFLFLAAAGRLGGPFPYSAGWGDVITGVAAAPLAWLVTREPGAHRGLIAAWNTFGALDLIVAVALGVTSINGSPLQLIHAGVGSATITQLPWAMVPLFLVPFFLITHGIVYAQLRSGVSVVDQLKLSAVHA